ncbi:MAG: hypothetical protein L6R40_006833 [Gallowayella cf. fulva]|nr:MAG: hypothetical protein L6R40_006833 [Xanthomendoza cf. fulva]
MLISLRLFLTVFFAAAAAAKQVTGRSGLYTIVGDSLKVLDDTHQLLQSLHSALQPVLDDLKTTDENGKPTPSAAYKLFFKSPVNIPFVTSIFINTTTGVGVLPNYQGPFHFQGSPVIYTLSAPGQIIAHQDGVAVDMFQRCTSSSTLTATHPTGTPYILLCPFFWTATPPSIYDTLPPKSTDGAAAPNCLKTNHRLNKFILNGGDDGTSLIQYRMWILMEEIAHYYIFQSLQTNEDVRPVNDVLKLPYKRTKAIVQSYMYYAASELSPPVSIWGTPLPGGGNLCSDRDRCVRELHRSPQNSETRRGT